MFLELVHGIPAHDTFWRVPRLLNSEPLEACFLRWIQAVSNLTGGQVVAIDGKQRCGAIDRVSGWAATAIYHDLTLITHNRRHLSRIPTLKLSA